MWWRDLEGAEPTVILRAVDLQGKRVLDVGCGSGRLTAFAAEHANEVYAFDPDEEGVEEAHQRLPPVLRERVKFAICGAEELARPARRFDIALCGWSL
jgi:ubiquinone/menaquinone biosynthesis C-methylase UbiE